MGQAKLRGTYEERKAAAILRDQEKNRITGELRLRRGKSDYMAIVIAALAASGHKIG